VIVLLGCSGRKIKKGIRKPKHYIDPQPPRLDFEKAREMHRAVLTVPREPTDPKKKKSMASKTTTKEKGRGACEPGGGWGGGDVSMTRARLSGKGDRRSEKINQQKNGKRER